MSAPSLPSLSDLPATDALRLEQLCNRFEAAWQSASGPRPRIEAFLEEVRGPSRAVLLCELLRLDLVYCRQQGERPTAAAYLARFPEEEGRIQAVLAEDRAGARTIKAPPPPPPEDGKVARPAPLPGRAETVSDLRWSQTKQVGKYRIVSVLGAGGQAVTFKAWDPDLQRHVVLKVYHAAQPSPQLEAVLKEGQALARVRSPYVARCLDVAHFENIPYLVLEYVPGRTLAELHKTRPLLLPQMLELLAQATEGLAAVHACGLLHRDLKPANILVGDDGLPRLIDFGLARPLGDTALLVSGTLDYMPPEQARGELERIDSRADLFGMGAVFYALLTGSPPYQADTHAELWRQARAGQVIPVRERNPKVPAAVAAACMRCLAPDPGQRFASAAELACALRGLRSRVRVRWLVAAGALLLILMAVAGGFLLPAFFPAPLPPLKGELDVRIWESRSPDPLKFVLAGQRQGIRLPEAVPLTGRDWMRIEARLNRPAHLYVIWIDTEGKATPIYPWQDDDWTKRPPDQPAQDRLSLPEKAGELAPLAPGPAGIETVLLLARDTPLTDAENAALPGLFTGLARAEVTDLRAAAWFEDGQLLTAQREPERGPIRIGQAQAGSDPVLQTQALLQTKLRSLFHYSRAVCFGNAGK
jgi:Ser/Thr protein kinase RdoA (MazF antagonist)